MVGMGMLSVKVVLPLMRGFFSGLFVLFAAAIFFAVSMYDLFSSYVAKLRGQGEVGVFFANLIMSPGLFVFLFLMALFLIVYGINENLKLRRLTLSGARAGTEPEEDQWHETPEYDLTGEQPFTAQPSLPGTSLPSTTTERSVEIGRLQGSVYSDDVGKLRGATVTAENEYTNRKYIATTDSQGHISLAVPHGNYSVTIEAEDHLTRTEAIRVGDEYSSLINGRLQMTGQAHKTLVADNVRGIIETLADFSAEGSKLLEKARGAVGATEAMQLEASQWESKVADYLKSRLGRAEETLFLTESPMEEYLIAAATTAHRSYLNRINTRVVRLNRLIARLNEQLDRGMLF